MRGESLLGNRLVAAHPGSSAETRRLSELAGPGARKLAWRKSRHVVGASCAVRIGSGRRLLSMRSGAACRPSAPRALRPSDSRGATRNALGADGCHRSDGRNGGTFGLRTLPL